MSEFRDGILKTGHRGRGSGIGLSMADLEKAIFADRLKRPTFYVRSAAASGGSGASWGDEFQTIQEAVDYAPTDSLILVAPLHVETVSAAAGLELDKAGLTILGYGNGNRRPQVNFTTVVGADMNVGAAGVTVYNFRFTGGFDALTAPIDVNAADFTMIDCITEDVTGQALDFILTDANADRMTLIRWEHRGATAAGAQTAISMVGGDQITIEDAWIHGDFATACIENLTTSGTNHRIYGGAKRPCYLRNINTSVVLVTYESGTTGDIGPFVFGRIVTDAANVTEAYVGAAMRFFQPCQVVNADGERGFDTNIAVSAG